MFKYIRYIFLGIAVGQMVTLMFTKSGNFSLDKIVSLGLVGIISALIFLNK